MPLMTYTHTDTAQARMVARRRWGLGRALPDRGVPDLGQYEQCYNETQGDALYPFRMG
jgi:hypothetical protein